MTSPSTPSDGDMPDGLQLVLMLREKLGVVRENHPDWYAQYEDSDPITTDAQTLKHLIDTAPDQFVCGLLAGIMMFRQQLALLTGRPF